MKLKVGHAGTLDPLATGVMIVCTGKATKRIEEFQYHTKGVYRHAPTGGYYAVVRFGTRDRCYLLYRTYHTEMVEEVLTHFIGIDRTGSSCLLRLHGGWKKRAYELARKGEEVELKAKQLVIDEIELLECCLETPEPMIRIRVVCSKGTYIRALARDIGEALHSGAHRRA